MKSDSYFQSEAMLRSQAFVKKNGQAMDFHEFYLEMKGETYFVKFCEGEVPRSRLESLPVDAKIKVMVAIKEGLWDVCDDNMDQQSRVGQYVVLKEVLQ